MYELRCLGEATLRSPTGQLVHFRSRKHFALLTYLALNADRAHRRERLAGLFWSDTDDTKARHSLSQALYAIRRLLDGSVRIEGEDLELSPDGLQIDTLEMERQMASGDVCAAADMYRGTFLEGFWVKGAHGFDEWAARERARVGALARDALRQAIKTGRDRCDWAEVRGRAERLIVLDPFDEVAYAELMRALWMLGDRAEALDRYADLERVLAAELGSHPTRETEALANRIRQRPVRGGWSSQRLLRESHCELLHDPPFVGRKRELSILSEEWDRVTTGETRTVALAGAAGIGKTRLADEFINSLALNDATILRGRCYEAEQTLPYGPVAEALRQAVKALELDGVNPLWIAELARIVPEVQQRVGDLPKPAVLDAEGSRRRLYEGIAQVLRATCETRPVLFFVDDLHWADDSSLSLLHYLHRRVSNGLYLLTSHRPEEVDSQQSAPTADLLSERNPRVQTITLDGLDRAASSNLLTALIGDDPEAATLAKLQAMSGGNPFFAIELARSLSEDEGGAGAAAPPVPDSIRALLEKRFAGLAERSIACLQQAACLGTRVSYRALSAAVGLAPVEFDGVLRELSRARILGEAGGVIRFRHDLIREVAWAQVPEALRGALHLRAARALTRVDGSYGEIAGHFSAGGDGKRAHAFALHGVERAKKVFALDEAAGLLQLAIKHAPREATRVKLVGELGRLYLHVREYDKARPLLEERLTSVECRGQAPVEIIEARRDVILVNMYSSRAKIEESARALWELAQQLLAEQRSEPRLVAEVLQAVFWAATRSFNVALVEHSIAQIERLHRTMNQPEVKSRTARSLAIHQMYMGNTGEAQKLLSDAKALSIQANDQDSLIQCHVALSALLHRLPRAELANSTLEYAVPLAEQHADPAHVSHMLCNCAACYMYLGEADRAEALLERARNKGTALNHFPDVTASIWFDLGYVAQLRQQYDQAQVFWRRSLEASKTHGMLSLHLESLAALGGLALRRGSKAEARRLAAQALRLARKGGALVDQRLGIEDLLARLRFLSGKHVKAVSRLAAVASKARKVDIPLYLSAQLTRLELLARMGEKDKAKKVKTALCKAARSWGAAWWIEKAENMERSLLRKKQNGSFERDRAPGN